MQACREPREAECFESELTRPPACEGELGDLRDGCQRVGLLRR